MEPAFVRGQRVVLPDGVRPALLQILDGRIVAVRAHADVPAGTGGIDAGDLVVLPGLVDTHVHVNEPGRTEWEGFAHATRAAAASPESARPARTTSRSSSDESLVGKE